MEGEIKPGDVFTHNETGATCVVDLTGQMKQEARPWEPAVTYHRVTEPDKKFTRLEHYFRLYFTRGAKE